MTRTLLKGGSWPTFFGSIGRLDLAMAAKQAAKEPALDVGLSQLLEKFPADSDAGIGARVPTLRDRLPADLRDARRPDFAALPFSSLYMIDDEFAAEIANRTVHGVMHVGWVPDGSGGFRGQMAVLVKPNGLLGSAYMAAIRPFRHLIVYPPAIRQIEREWRARTPDPAPA